MNFTSYFFHREYLSKRHKNFRFIAMIANIIEDAFIDAAGCSVYDNLSSYIVWRRVLTAFRTMKGQSTIERTFSKTKEEGTISEEILIVQEILEYLGYKYVYFYGSGSMLGGRREGAIVSSVIMLSDGVPVHKIDDADMYVPPVSVKNTANEARKITSRGTKIVAIALACFYGIGIVCRKNNWLDIV